MTVEELLEPRYKVIADYPYCPYPIGSLVEQTATRFLFTRTTCYDSFKMDLAEQDNYVPEQTILKYPNLFKKLEWWEERKESDMPEYVRYNDLSLYYPKEIICKSSEAPFLAYKYTADNFIIATKEEYDEYAKKITDEQASMNLCKRFFEECMEGDYGERRLKVSTEELKEWLTKFPGMTALSCLKHLQKEVGEAIEELEVADGVGGEGAALMEFADMYLLLLQSAARKGFTFEQLHTAGMNKMVINRKRKWGKLNEEGFSEHIKESVPLIDKGDPEPEMVSREEYENAVNEIGQLQEQLKDAENEIRELNRFNNERF